MPDILLMASLDTRRDEAVYLKALIEAPGCKVILVDTSMGQYTESGADYSCMDVAREGGTSFEQVAAQKGTSSIIDPMIKGCVRIAKSLHEKGSINAIAGFGGATGTLFLSSVMKSLPFGFPKLILSSSAAMPMYSARYFAHKDIVIFHACVDLNGLNTFVKDVLKRFAGLVTGVAGIERQPHYSGNKQVAISEFQFSETCARRIRDSLLTDRFEMVPFHAQGVGDRIMEEMVADGLFSAVIDLVPAGLSEAIMGGNRSAGLDRLNRELDQGIPVILTPSGFDMLSCGPYERRFTDPLWKKKKLEKRKLYVQDELRVQARTTKHEMEVIGRVFAEKLNRARGNTVLFIPLKGFSSLDREGGPLYDPDADGVFIKSLKGHLITNGRRVELIEMDCHVNDPPFADSIVERFIDIMAGKG